MADVTMILPLGSVCRGMLALVVAPGGYFWLPKLLLMLVLITPWLAACTWVDKDVLHVRGPHGLWSGAVLGAGAMGVLLWLLLPLYLLGMGVYVALAGGALLAYVSYRNSRVEADERVTLNSLLPKAHGRRGKQLQTVTKVKLYDSLNKQVMPPTVETAEDEATAGAYNTAQDLMYSALWRRASEIDVMPSANGSRVRLVVDGVAVEQQTMALGESEAMVQYLKQLAGMNLEERRRPQKGRLLVDMAGQSVDVVVATAGTTGGQRMQIRMVQESVKTHLAELGMSDDVLGRITEINNQTPGLIIVAGRSGSGVTSTLYSLLRQHDAFIRHLVTLEQSIEVELENVTQVAYEPQQLPDSLASVLRRDPDVVMIDRCGEERTAGIIAEAAADKGILLGMHAGDAFTALAKWLKMSNDTAAAMGGLKAVCCQMLLRRLCPDCREAYRPDPQMLAKANMPAAQIDKFYRPPTRPLTDAKGNVYTCPTCQGSGYLGRTAAFELLEITDSIRQLVVQGASLSQIKSAARKNKMLYLQEQALRKVVQGLTGIQEVLRVTQEAKTK